MESQKIKLIGLSPEIIDGSIICRKKQEAEVFSSQNLPPTLALPILRKLGL